MSDETKTQPTEAELEHNHKHNLALDILQEATIKLHSAAQAFLAADEPEDCAYIYRSIANIISPQPSVFLQAMQQVAPLFTKLMEGYLRGMDGNATDAEARTMAYISGMDEDALARLRAHPRLNPTPTS